ncbi:MAG: copper resistance CopC/CopD family protein [Euzebya sp.]
MASLPLALLILVMLAGPASAHAVLQGGSVFDGQVLQTAPEELFLEFNENINSTRGGVRVYDSGAERVDESGTFQTDDAPELVRVGLADDLAEGTYAVTYRVTSADGHPVNGAFVFSVGAESGAADALVAQVFSSDADRPYSVVAAIARWIMYLGTLVAAGAVAVLWWLRPVLAEEADLVRPWVMRAAWAAVGATVVGLVLQTILVSGDGVASALDLGNLTATLRSFVGISGVLRIIGAGLLILVARRMPGSLLTCIAGGVMLVSLLLEGHTLTTGPPAVVWAAATVHIATAALWLGGLVVLAVVLRARRRADDPVGAGRLVARFSVLFTVSVVAVVLAGTALSWAEVRAVRALLSTSYGWVLVAKIATVVPLVAIGAYNNRRLVPTLTARRSRNRSKLRGSPVVAGGSDELADKASGRDQAWAHLRRTVRIEVGIIGIVLALTGVLVALQPAAEAAGITGAYSENVQFPGVGQMTFTVDPNRSGQNEIHLYLLGDTGRPVDVAQQVTLSLSQPELDIGPLIREPIEAGPGHYLLSGPELSIPGRWEITTEVALDRFQVVSTTVSVEVNP